MVGISLPQASEYNKNKAGKLWRQQDLPWPLNIPDLLRSFLYLPGSSAFTGIIGMFQESHGLKLDGKLGPATYAVMRSCQPAVTETIDAHEFEEEALPAIPEDISPARNGVSNCLIIDGKGVEISDDMISLGITASNYQDDDEKQFDQYRKRSKKVTHFVIHESVTMSAAQTNRVLDNKRKASARKGKNNGKGYDYGIHLNLSPDGHISCHADLVQHRLVQANHLNDESFGIEVVNPYNPIFAKPPFDKTIDGPWWCWNPKRGDKIYTLPTPAQLRAIAPLCELLTREIDTLPLEFPTAKLNARNRRIDGWKDGRDPGPGIVAHRDFASHADGRYLLEYVIEQIG